jgi:hypothetical protein
MISNTTPRPELKATIPTTGLIKWVEPVELVESDECIHEDFATSVKNKREYFDDLQKAVAGITALMNSEMSASEILKRAEMEVKKIETETYDVVREFLGDEVTEQMQKINHDLDELASLVSGIEASLAGFSPLIEEEDATASAKKSAA